MTEASQTPGAAPASSPGLFPGVLAKHVVGGTLVVVTVVGAFWLTHRFAGALKRRDPCLSVISSSASRGRFSMFVG